MVYYYNPGNSGGGGFWKDVGGGTIQNTNAGDVLIDTSGFGDNGGVHVAPNALNIFSAQGGQRGEIDVQIPQVSARAEVPGQIELLQINLTGLGYSHNGVILFKVDNTGKILTNQFIPGAVAVVTNGKVPLYNIAGVLVGHIPIIP